MQIRRRVQVHPISLLVVQLKQQQIEEIFTLTFMPPATCNSVICMALFRLLEDRDAWRMGCADLNEHHKEYRQSDVGK